MKRKGLTRDNGNEEKKIGNSERLIQYLVRSISEKEAELECPVCLTVVEAGAAVFSCQQQHLLCSVCRPRLTECPACREKYSQAPLRHRFAEKMAGELCTQRRELAALQGEKQTNLATKSLKKKSINGN